MAARWLTASLEVRNILGTDHREIRILKRQIPRGLRQILTQQPQMDSTENDVEENVAAEYGMGQQL